MYCIKINLCVSLTHAGDGVSPELSQDSQTIEEKPTEAAVRLGAAHPQDSVAAGS